MRNRHGGMAAQRHGGWIGRTAMIALGVVVLGTASAYAAGERAVDLRLIRGLPDHVVLEAGMKDFSVEPVVIDGRKYAQITLGRESRMKTVGAPELPHICRSVMIPDDGQMTVRVTASEHYDIEGVDVAPSKGIISRSVNPKDVPYTFGDVYQADSFYPGEVAGLREPYILRDYRGTVVEINPFQYNPVRHVLRVYTSVTVEVVSTGPGGANVLKRPAQPRSLSRSFHQIYSRQFLNYALAGRYPAMNETGDMLIIAHDAWIANVQPLANHKENIGIGTTIVGVSTIGNNPTSIKNYIQGVYNTTDLAFVLLVGDATQVRSPSVTVGSETESADPTYALLHGSDHYPDILIGRFSAETPGQVDTQVQRTIEYELMPATMQDWFKRATGIGSDEGPGDDGEYDFEHIDNIRDDLLAYGYTVVDQTYDPGATAAMVTNALNAGRGLVNYTGHGSPYAWGTTGFSNTYINALANDNKLPLIFSVACNNGTFDGYTCFAETWLRATRGTEPTGAIAVYASSVSQHWEPPMCAQDEFVDQLMAEVYTSYGALCFAGSCQMMDEYGVGGVEMYDTWHIFGDPSLRVFYNCPEAGTVSFDRDRYGCEIQAVVSVVDCGLNEDDQAAETVTVTLSSDSEPAGETIVLTETAPASAEFMGAVTLSETDAFGVLLVADGDTITTTYIDANNGAGGVNVQVTATAAVDCGPPQVSNVRTTDIAASRVTVRFDSDEPARGLVRYGTSCAALVDEAGTQTYTTTVTVPLTGLAEDTTYFYTVEATDEAGNSSQDDNGGLCHSFATLDVPDFFTELFVTDNDLNDLDNVAIMLTPDGSSDFYTACAHPITALPTSPDGGTVLTLDDDDWASVSAPGGQSVSLYGSTYAGFYVGSNGYVTFGGGDDEYRESLANHFAMPRVSGLFDDLNPTVGEARISWEAFEDRVAITWLNVREWSYTTTNTFQIELYFDGRIQLGYLGIAAKDGIAGLSAGLGLHPDFLETDLSAFGDCAADCNGNGVPDPQDIASGTSEDCNDNGIPDECETDCNGTGVPDDCDIAGGTSLDCNGNGVPDECDIAGGGSPDVNENGVPDECECPPADAVQAESPPVAKPRYVSFTPGNPGRQTALRLKFADLPSPFDVLNGKTMWIGDPDVVSEHAGSVHPADAPGWPTCVVATLQCDPVFMDWSEASMVHVYHEYIVPGGLYEIQAVVEGCPLSFESSYSAALSVSTSRWGDVVKDCSVVPCGPPDGSVGITTDVTALVDKFKNLAGCLSKARSDLEPARVDQRINITDVTYTVEAFLGRPYPFPGPSVTEPCPQVGADDAGLVVPAGVRSGAPKRPRSVPGR